MLVCESCANKCDQNMPWVAANINYWDFNLTVSLVYDKLHLHRRLVFKRFLHLLNGLFISQVPIHEVASTAFLHDISPRASRHFAESIIAVDDGVPDHSCVRQDEVAICNSKNNGKKSN